MGLPATGTARDKYKCTREQERANVHDDNKHAESKAQNISKPGGAP